MILPKKGVTLIHSFINPASPISDPPLFLAQGVVGRLSYHVVVQNFEICTFPLFLAHFKTLKFSKKKFKFFNVFFKNAKIAISTPKRGADSSGKVLLKMRHGQGVPIKELARDFNVSRRIVKKYLNEKKTTPVYTLSPERKKIMNS